MFEFLKTHGTKVLGFLGITVAVLATADPALVGGTTAIKYYLLAQSLLTVWRGFFNSDVINAKVDAKTQEIINKNSGFVRVSMLLSLFALAAVTLLQGCTGTRAAYKEASGVDEQAYVAVEQYSALVKEAANLATLSTTPPAAVEAMKAADRAAQPVVKKVRELRDQYLAVKNADNEAELQKAVNDAILLIADMVRAVKHARGEA